MRPTVRFLQCFFHINKVVLFLFMVHIVEASSLNNTSKSSIRKEMPTSTIFPKSTELSNATKLTSSTDLPKSTELPKSTKLPKATELAKSTVLPLSTKLPTSTEMPKSIEITTSTKFPKSTKLPKSTELPKGNESNTSTELPKSTELSASTQTPISTESTSSNKMTSETTPPACKDKLRHCHRYHASSCTRRIVWANKYCQKYCNLCDKSGCPLGRFGENCDKKCHCKDDKIGCDKESGACSSGCARGWTGSDCQTQSSCKDATDCRGFDTRMCSNQHQKWMEINCRYYCRFC